MKLSYILVGIGLIWSGGFSDNALAARPLNTDDAGVVAQRVFEWEVGYEYVEASNNQHIGSAVMTTGLWENVDMGVEIPYQFIDNKGKKDVDGFADISISTKWNFFDNQEDMSAAFRFDYKAENGDVNDGLGSGEEEYTLMGIFSAQINELVVHLNVGPTLIEDGEDALNYLIALEAGLTEQWVLVAEVFGSTTHSGGFHDNPLSVLLGFVYGINEDLTFDTGVGIGISKTDPDLSLTTGLTFAFD